MTPWRVEALDEIDSTQEEVKRRLRRGDVVAGLVLRAGRQLAGRGRRGRAFASEPGGSYQSLGIADPEGRWRHGATVLALAVGLAEALGARRAGVRLKWPNDLLAEHGPKLGGLMAEHVRDHLVVGVGLNVGASPEGFAALNLPLERVHEAVLEGVERGLVAAAEPDRLPRAYAAWDALAGRTVTVREGEGAAPRRGAAAGIDADGALLLRGPDGEAAIRTGTVTEVAPPLDAPAGAGLYSSEP